jgi:hypothetical protein
MNTLLENGAPLLAGRSAIDIAHPKADGAQLALRFGQT